MAYRAFKPEYFDRMLLLAKKQPVFFAYGLDAKGNPVFALDESLDGKGLFTKLKSETGAKKGGYGKATLASGTMNLTCEQSVAGMARALRDLAKEKGWAAKKFNLTDPSGAVIGEEGAPATAAPVAAAAGAAAPAAPAGGSPMDLRPAPPEEVKSALAKIIENSKGPPVTPAYGVNPEDNAALDQMDAETLREQNLTVRDPNELFTEEYMDGLVGLKMQGANQPGLKDVMRKLTAGVSGPEREACIQQLAKERGRDPKELDAEYGRFLVLRKQQEAVRASKGGDAIEPLDEGRHDEFLGSNPQLVYGKVVGDAYGIDPVFGALLNPTGGMVGPGNMALHMDDDDPTGYHGIVHDAAGYMFNYHDQGPGYNYLGEEGRDTADPLTGQQSGMKYWHEKLNPGVTTTVLGGVIDVVYGVKDTIDDVVAMAKAAGNAVVDTVKDIKVKVEKAVQTVRDAVTPVIDKAVQAAVNGVKTAATAVASAATAVAKGVQHAAEVVADTAVEVVQDVGSALGDAGEAVADTVSSAWNYLWS